MFHVTDDVRIETIRPLIPPAILMEEIPLTDANAERVAAARGRIAAVVAGVDDRVMVVVGPCSIHSPEAGLAYADRLAPLAQRLSPDLVVVMRTYFEKPRTTVGWKGLINDPHLDESFAINRGLRIARQFLVDVISRGLPTATEYLDPISPQFMADCIAWGAIGARTTESQVHRELASGLSMPVGFKNGTGGNIQVAIDAARAARTPHHFLSVTKQGVAAIVATKGNDQCHVILRGGSAGTNYDEACVASTVASLQKVGLPECVMVDCSHANSSKDHRRQGVVADEIAARIAAGDRSVMGLMLESFLVEGRQDVAPGRSLVFGQSVTDACIGWEETEAVLERLAAAVRQRRSLTPRT